MREINLDLEREYENKKALGSNIRKNQDKYYWSTQIPLKIHERNSYRAIVGKSVLEIGCSSGYAAKGYAEHTKSYVGIDLSNEAIEKAISLELKNSIFICCDAHKIPFDNDKFDYVIVNSLLHHLDLDIIFPEIHRVLTTEGQLIFKEPLGTNPFFQLYRFLTPSARTIDERPFTFSDINLLTKYFTFIDIQWFGFFNIFSAFIRIDFIRKVLTLIDKVLACTPLKYFFWQFCGFAKKKL